ncbi:TIGR03936 family radical SAM-associated protein [Caldanaerobius polysaccharolyticus]|uniref:TIGR03936 family radical SAM-associated protein n=1 Tax=Caldanaerobius polysaccharolyticus TaxID=44256 RepID=UPI001FDEA465|nr:TIGR03936 family radical SAM-associated protein [Caldanaerobius polysaccharolyticus]
MRLKFEKKGDMRYISHLDLMRTLSRAVRRAQLPIAYSQGYNPQPKISIALPLSLGYTSDGEYMDMEFSHDISTQDVINRLNNQLPCGLKIKQCMEVGESKTSLMALIRYALYGVTFKDVDLGLLNNAVEDIVRSDHVMAEKKTKSGIKPVDIKGDIIKLYTKDCTLFMLVSAGSKRNLKPDLVLDALEDRYNGIKSKVVNVHRYEMYGENMKTPMEA